MIRFALWFLLLPQAFLLAGLVRDLGVPLDMTVLACLYLGWFAQRDRLPWLLLGAAVGRALIDEATLPVQILIVGLPVALLLPLRSLFVAQHVLWQALAAAGCAIAVPKLAGLFGQWFDAPSASATLDGWQTVWSALLVPLVLPLANRLPPFAGFVEGAE